MIATLIGWTSLDSWLCVNKISVCQLWRPHLVKMCCFDLIYANILKKTKQTICKNPYAGFPTQLPCPNQYGRIPVSSAVKAETCVFRAWTVRGIDAGWNDVTIPHVDTSIMILARGLPSWLRQRKVRGEAHLQVLHIVYCSILCESCFFD